MIQEALEGFRLSLQQRRVWRLQQDSPAYGAQCAVLLTGNLHTAALSEAIQHVMQRHEMLRTTFHAVEGLEFPLQVIVNRGMPWRQDLRSPWGEVHRSRPLKLPSCSGKSNVLLLTTLTGRSCVSLCWPLPRETHLLLISLPALCADTWTLNNLVQEIGQSYAAYPQPAALPEVLMQYADFAAWQQDVLADADGEAGRAYWQAQDPSADAVGALPGGGRPAGNAGDVPQTLAVTLTADELTQIAAMAQQYDTSVAVCLLACWQSLLWRLTGQSDVVVGYVCDGRKYPELHGAMGLFAQTLPIRGHFADNPQLPEIVRQLHEAVHTASAWMEYYPESYSLDTTFAAGFSFTKRLAQRDYAGRVFCRAAAV